MKLFGILRFSWLWSGRRKSRTIRKKQPTAARPFLEAFEDRLVPSSTPIFNQDFNPDGSAASTVNTGWLAASPSPFTGPVHSDVNGTLAQFNSALGTLTSVDIEEVASFTTTGTLENTSTSSSNTISAEADLTATLTAPSVSAVQVSEFFAQKFTPFNATVAGTSGDSTSLNETDSNLIGTQTLTSAAALAAFTGTGSLAVQEDINGTTTISGLPQMNNTVYSTGSVQVFVRYHYEPADLSITKTANPTSVSTGGPVTYTLTATNNGPGAASNVVVTDSLPAGETLVSATPPAGWTEQTTANGVSFTAPSMANGATATFTIAVTAPATAGQVTNTATIGASTTDTNPNNNTATSTITVSQPQTDLAITKSATPTTTTPGGAISYTLTVTNNGPNAASNVVVQDSLPTGEVLTGTTPPAGWTAQSTTNGVTFTDPTLAAGASATFVVSVTAPTTAGTVTNTATVSSSTLDSNPNNNQATATVTVTAIQTDLAITKMVTPTTTLPSGALTYTMTVTNDGASDASNVVVQDSLPAGEILSSATLPTGWTVQSTTGGVTFSDADLAAGATATLSLAVIAPSTAGTYTNTATVSSSTPDSNPNNNQATAVVTVTPTQTDLAITKTASPTSVQVGGTIAYTLTVTNSGPNDASNVVVQDSLPTGETLISTTPPIGWTVQSTTAGVTFSDPLLSSGATASFIVTVSAPSTAGTVTNTATVSSATPDSNPNNNQATAVVTVTAAQADLAITKSVSPSTTTPGGAVTYTLVISNNGPTTASGVVVQDALPGGELLSSASLPTGWSVQSTTNGVTFSDASMASGESDTITLNVVAPTTAGQFTNTATVSSSTPDSNPNNNQASAVLTVAPIQTDLSITKSASPTTVQEGGAVTYMLTVTNNGSAAASNVNVQDSLPAGEIYLSATEPSGWSVQNSSGTVTFQSSSLAAGASATFTVSVLAPNSAGSVTNTATVGSSTPDTNPNNNTATSTITVTVPPADLSIVKTANPTTVMAGGSVTYTIAVSNTGPGAANGITVLDSLPNGETFVSSSQPAGWSEQNSNDNVTFTGGSLASGATATFTITVIAPSTAGTVVNTASVTSLTPDPNPSNNTTTSTIIVTPLTADLSIVKTANPTTVQAGGIVTYTITVSNSGPGAASGVTVLDSLPSGETYLTSSAPTGWTEQNTGSYVTFTGGSVASGATATFTIMVIAPNTAGTVVNVATVTSQTPDPNPTNNTTTSTITVTPVPADLSITKMVDPTTVLAGGAATYTIVVTNLGAGVANSVTMIDPLPPGETFVSATEPAGWTVVDSGGTVTFSGASLASGASATFTIAVTAPNTAGTYTNKAVVSSLTPDPNLANNSAIATLTVQPNTISPEPPPILPPTTPPPPTTSLSKQGALGSDRWWLSYLS